MRVLIALCLLIPVQDKQDEIEKARDALTKGLKEYERFSVDRSLTTLAKINDEKIPEVLIGLFRAGVLQIADLEKERQKILKEMEKVEPKRDKEGKLLSGDVARWNFLKRDHDLLWAKIEFLNGAVPRIASTIGRLTTTKPIILALNNSAEWFVRACCAEALGRIEQPEAVTALLARAGREGESGVRIAIADALAPLTAKNEDARKALVAWLEGGTWGSRLAAAQALSRSGDKTMVPKLIKMLAGITSGRMKYEINECLKKMTGVSKHGDYAAWTNWWEQNENDFLAGTFVASKADIDDGPGVTQFYGIPLHSTKVVFIIDASLSMKETSTWKPEVDVGIDKLEGERCLDIARYELRKIIRQIPEGASFDIIAMYGKLSLLSEKWVVAAKDARERAVKFVQGIDLRSGTDLHGALMRALDFSGGSWNTPPREDSVDTIFVLTDGMPSVGMADISQIPDRIADAARFKRIAITSVAISPPKLGRELLKKISDGSGGMFVVR